MKTARLKVYGIVQGVGMRPVVARHAAACGVTGTVANLGPYVEIFAQGDEKKVDEFVRLIEEEPPKRAAILKIDNRTLDDAPIYGSFEIIESGKTSGEIFISPDIAVCDECLEELYDKKNRRYLHPFINCTCCGPRLTILDSLPYDRERTSMKEFPMCEKCAAEYEDPATRRYDAQPVCCNDCGPEVFILDDPENRRGREAITYARKLLSEGGIVAVKGIGENFAQRLIEHRIKLIFDRCCCHGHAGKNLSLRADIQRFLDRTAGPGFSRLFTAGKPCHWKYDGSSLPAELNQRGKLHRQWHPVCHILRNIGHDGLICLILRKKMLLLVFLSPCGCCNVHLQMRYTQRAQQINIFFQISDVVFMQAHGTAGPIAPLVQKAECPYHVFLCPGDAAHPVMPAHPVKAHMEKRMHLSLFKFLKQLFINECAV